MGGNMGRDVQAQVLFAGQSGLVRAVLESDALILRGKVRLRFPRAGLLGWQAEGDDLHLRTEAGPVVLTLGEAEAARWIAALMRPLPSLHDKLGLAKAAVWVMTPVDDAALSSALKGAVQATGADATPGVAVLGMAVLGVAVLRNHDDLARLLSICAENPDLPVWAINEKGKHAGLAENVIRAALRGLGMVDTKACAVSATLSGTRYQRRRG